jgi:DNA repair protein RecO (recombination protein O)
MGILSQCYFEPLRERTTGVQLYKAEGIVLRKQEFSENAEIISLLTPCHGKLKVMVRGVRKIKGSLVGKFELFSRLTVLLSTGRTFEACSQVEVLDHRAGLRDDLIRLAYGLYFLELFDVMLHYSEPHAGLFHLLDDSLGHLEKLSRFELLSVMVLFNFLHDLGYQPDLRNCVICGGNPVNGRFSVSQGGVLCPNCKEDDTSSLSLERDTLALMRSLPALSHEALLSGEIKEGTARKLREILEFHISYHFSRKLRTSALLRKIRGLGRTKEVAHD